MDGSIQVEVQEALGHEGHAGPNDVLFPQDRRGVYERKGVRTSWGLRMIIFILQKLSNVISNLHLHISSNVRVLIIYL